MNDLIKSEGSQVAITEQGIELLNRTICKDLNKEELALFAQVCQSKGLDPFSNQIYAIKRFQKNGGAKITFQTGIDGLRAIAERTGEYEGQEDPAWYDSEGAIHYVWLKKEAPSACRVGIFRKGITRPIRAIATITEFRVSTNPLWASMPSHMLAKCAEALALRKAFPQALGGIYEKDEPIRDEKETPREVSDLNSMFADDSNEPPAIPVEAMITKPKTAFQLFVGDFTRKCKEMNLSAEEQRNLFKDLCGYESFVDIMDKREEQIKELIERVNSL